MSLAALGSLASNAKIPYAQIGRRARVLSWGNNIAGPEWPAYGFANWSRTFTVPSEGGTMRCLIGSFLSSYFNIVMYGHAAVVVDGTTRVYHRIFVNAAGHRVYLPQFYVVDLAPGSHTLAIADSSGSQQPHMNNNWSYFVLATGPPPYTRSRETRTGAATLGAIPSDRHLVPGDTDQGMPDLVRIGRFVGDFQAVRQTGSPITTSVARGCLYVLALTGFNTAVGQVNWFGTYLRENGGAAIDTGPSIMSWNDGPAHRLTVPIVWYGTLPPGTWCPEVYRSATMMSNFDDFGQGFAILGV